MDIDSPESSTGSNDAAAMLSKSFGGHMSSSTAQGLDGITLSSSFAGLPSTRPASMRLQGAGGSMGSLQQMGMNFSHPGMPLSGASGSNGRPVGPQEWEWLTMSL
jgi:GATA-binding protein